MSKDAHLETILLEVLRRLVPRTVFKTVGPHGNHVVGGFDSHAFPPITLTGRAIPRTSSHRQNPSTENLHQARCFRCFRPEPSCYCHLVPVIQNQTEIVVLQHAKERDHPFNTARMVRMALDKVRLHCGSNNRIANLDLKLGKNAGLLFPGKESVCLDRDIDRPNQLVVLDGTWAHARTMLRDFPQLNSLRKFHLAPKQPGQYRIRLEPTTTSLSTVEAVVLALESLEPETQGLQKLIEVFNFMVQKQLDHPEAEGRYAGGRRSGRTLNVPRDLLGDASKIVVAYGEASYRNQTDNGPHDRRLKATLRPPLVWVAKRLGDGSGEASKIFARFLEPDVEMTKSFLSYLELTDRSFSESISIKRFKNEWNLFLQPDDVLVVYHQGNLRLLRNVSANIPQSVELKSVNLDLAGKKLPLGKFLASQAIKWESVLPDYGRAGKRLGSAIALVQYLRNLKLNSTVEAGSIVARPVDSIASRSDT